MPHVLVVGREPAIAQAFRYAFQGTEIEVHSTSSGARALRLLEQYAPDVFVWQGGSSGEPIPEIFHKIRVRSHHIPTLWVLGRDDVEAARAAMRAGALDCLLPPLDRSRLRDLVAKALEARRRMHVPVRLVGALAPEDQADALLGECEGMRQVQRGIARAAVRQASVLIRGEHGTGRELVARAIYHHSPRVSQALLAVDCAAVDEPWLEAELFGTQSTTCRPGQPPPIGKFEQADGGTLLLKEVGALPLGLQARLLEVLKRKRFLPAGGGAPVPAEAMVISTSSRDLERMVDLGQFNAELLEYLQPSTIRLPPLRERAGDIVLLAEHFLRRFGQEFGGTVRSIAGEAREVLKRYPWPGNVRELRSAVRQALLQASGDILLPECLPQSVRSCVCSDECDATHARSPKTSLEAFLDDRLREGTQSLYAQSLAFLDRVLLTRVLRFTGGNLSGAARVLGITRSRLRHKIRLLQATLGQALPATSAEGEGRRAAEAVCCAQPPGGSPL